MAVGYFRFPMRRNSTRRRFPNLKLFRHFYLQHHLRPPQSPLRQRRSVAGPLPSGTSPPRSNRISPWCRRLSWTRPCRGLIGTCPSWMVVPRTRWTAHNSLFIRVQYYKHIAPRSESVTALKMTPQDPMKVRYRFSTIWTGGNISAEMVRCYRSSLPRNPYDSKM